MSQEFVFTMRSYEMSHRNLLSRPGVNQRSHTGICFCDVELTKCHIGICFFMMC
jgi:hypothetical protein